MIGKLSAWFKGLTKSGKLVVVGTLAMSSLAVATGSANNETIITTKNETKLISVPFETTYQDDDALLITETAIVSPGQEGGKEVVYKVTYENGKETKRDIAKETVIKQPVNQLFKKGTREILSVEEVASIPFSTSTVSSAAMDKGASTITTAGANGSKVITYEITKIRSQEVTRKAVKEVVTVQPVTQVITNGTKVTPKKAANSAGCDPNYGGACVPIASDVDCGGGSGNGPAYVYGTVKVTGSDIYDLDRDGDGYGCD